MNWNPGYTVPLVTVLALWMLALAGLYLRGIMDTFANHYHRR